MPTEPTFEYRHLRDPHGNLSGCFRWMHGDEPMCDHEHDEFDTMCEDARIEMSSVQARLATATDAGPTLCSDCQGSGLDSSHDAALYYAHTSQLSACPTCGGSGAAGGVG